MGELVKTTEDIRFQTNILALNAAAQTDRACTEIAGSVPVKTFLLKQLLFSNIASRTSRIL